MITQPDNNPQGIGNTKVLDYSPTAYKDDSYMYTLEAEPVEVTRDVPSMLNRIVTGTLSDAELAMAKDMGVPFPDKADDIFDWVLRIASYMPKVGKIFKAIYPVYATEKQNAQQRKWAEDQATKEYQRQKELIREANAYNERWDQRLRSAGINPLSAFSKGTQGFQSSNAKAPSVGNPTQFNSIQSMMQMMSVLSDINLKNANAKKVEAETTGQQNENATYWERHRASLESMLQGTESERARTRILNAQADVAEATKQNDIESAQFNTRRLYNEMVASDLLPAQIAANLESTYAGIIGQFIQNQIGQNTISIQGQTIQLNNISFQQAQLVLNEYAATSDARVASEVAQFNAAARKATVDAKWATVDKFFEKGQQVTGMLKDTGSFLNSLKPGVNISTTQTHEGFDKNGNPTWSRTTTNTQRTPTR